jgi:thiol-disulfide isomerase/thioredoxin
VVVFCGSPSHAEPAKTAPATVELKDASYNQLIEAVKAHRGKVVVVDVWGDFCIPCKKAFPHLVEMSRNYGDKGLVCITVCIPSAGVEPAKDRANALKFLTAQKAMFQNFYLENGWDVLNDKWKVKGVPTAFVFDRDGFRAKKFNNDDPDRQYTLDDVKKVVIDLLAAKK